jgi:putative drug exporter of the RND superfamily
VGVGVVFFQFLLHQPIYWNVQATAFIVLVAVGADYNLLLITRIREESRTGVRSGIIRAVRSTGRVITSAGIIFAASMSGLLFGSLSTMVQTGFIIGMGILIDTFVVRTVTVPALAALIGKANWWPSKKKIHAARTPVAAEGPAIAVTHGLAPNDIRRSAAHRRRALAQRGLSTSHRRAGRAEPAYRSRLAGKIAR